MHLVVGGTGVLGGKIARSLLERGDAVRALVREDSDTAGLAAAGAELVVGNLMDRASIDRALEGVEAVITTATSTKTRRPEDTAQNVDLDGNANLIAASEAAGARRLVFVSAFGMTEDAPIEFERAKALTERRLREGALPYTVLTPDAFMQVWPAVVVGVPVMAGAPVTLVGEPVKRHSFVSDDDVVAYAVAVLGSERAENATIDIGGPEALTWREVVEVFERVTGRPIPIRVVQPGEEVPLIPPLMAAVLPWVESHDSIIDMTETSAVYGVTPTPLETVVRQMLAG